MRFPVPLLFALASSGCTLWFSGGDDTIDPCVYEATGGSTEPAIAEAQRRDPSTLTCQSFGSYPCDDRCGPCPGVPEQAEPSWGYCGSSCEQLSESACSADPACRVVKDAACSFGAQICFTDYMGCFPVDQVTDPRIDCYRADAAQCSRSNACTAYHSTAPCSSSDPQQCERPFEVCAPEGQHPGDCLGMIACDELPPPCPSGSTPGITDGCYTGACIRRELCTPTT